MIVEENVLRLQVPAREGNNSAKSVVWGATLSSIGSSGKTRRQFQALTAASRQVRRLRLQVRGARELPQAKVATRRGRLCSQRVSQERIQL